MRSVFDAFVGQNFDPVFSDIAVAPWAEYIAHIDLETHQKQARAAIHEVVRNASLPLPSQRIALIEGRAGFGKTHAIVAELWKLSRAGAVYPAIMQLSVMLAPEDISLWMLRATIEELSKSDFKDTRNRTPLKRLADGLWDHAQPDRRQAYLNAREKGDDSQALALASKAAPAIHANLRDRGVRLDHEPIIAGLLLAADDASYAFTNWLRGGAQEVKLKDYVLPPLTSEDNRRQALLSIATLAAATGAPLLLVFDQIEAASRVADHAHLGKLIASAVQLVEHNVVGTGVIISALRDTFKTMRTEHLDASFVDRIENGVAPVTLEAPKQEELRDIIDKRSAYLLELSGVTGGSDALRMMVPDWLLASAETTMFRPVLQAVRNYRNASSEAGRFLTEQEFLKDERVDPDKVKTKEQLPSEEFEKLWQDAIDADFGAVANIPAAEKADLFQWLAENVADELPQIDSLTVERITAEGTNPTRIFDLQYKDADGVPFERWKIAATDAPNSQNQLRDQITEFLDNAHNALPALLHIGRSRLPRIQDDGEPVDSIAHVRGKNGQPQTGEPLANLLQAGGRIAPTSQRDWIRLRLARQFVEQRRDAKGFTAWRAQRRFLLNMAGIGVMTKLLQPKNGIVRASQHSEKTAKKEQARGNGQTASQAKFENVRAEADPSSDPRDHADILLGSALPEGAEVRWCLDKMASPTLPNFGFMVSGDAGQGKTQLIKALIAEVARLDCPILIFDFKNDYSGDFALEHGFETIDLNDGLPFNPLQLPPHGASGAQAINHIFEIAGLLGATLRLGDRQKALLRQALEAAFAALGVPLRDWVDPDTSPAPSLADVIEQAHLLDETLAGGLIDRLGLLHGKRLLPASSNARMRLANLLNMRAVLSFNGLPNDDQLKRALAELILIQLQGHMLRGEQPRALRRLLVFDEAWRAADSKRLIQIAREGRAFGVGVIAGSQFADDLSGELTGNLASKLHLYNSDATKRRKLVQALLGTASGVKPNELTQTLGGLKQFEAVFTNQQYAPYAVLQVTPHFKRRFEFSARETEV